jgi:hypothetical protein
VAASFSAFDSRLWALPPLLLGAGLLAVPPSAAAADAPLASALAAAGRVGFVLPAFALAFHDVARWTSSSGGFGDPRRLQSAEAASVAAIFAVGALVLGLSRRWAGGRALAEALVAAAGVGGVALGIRQLSPEAVAVAANAALVGLAGLRVAEGLTAVRRWPFWEGVGLAAALLVSRFLEIERLLWLKGLGFIACAAAVSWAALAFERRRQEVRHVA